MSGFLTEPEIAIVQQLADAYLAFNNLPDYHSADIDEFNSAIHAAQYIVMQRLAIRAHPDLFINIVNSR